MPDVGTLNIRIESDAQAAATGLNSLAKALGNVQKNIGQSGLNLSALAKAVNAVSGAVQDSKGLANIGTFLNAVANYTSAIKSLGKASKEIDVSPISKIQSAIGDGIKIGTAGTQLNKLREALVADWKTTNADDASTALGTIAAGVRNINSSSITTTIKNINALADSLNKMAGAAKNVNDTPGAHDYLGMQVFAPSENAGAAVADKIAEGIKSGKETVVETAVSTAKEAVEEAKKEIDRMVETGGWGMAMRLGRFSSSPEYGSGGKNGLDGLLQKTTETTQKITDEYKQMTGAIEKTPLDFSKFMDMQIPLSALGSKIDDASQQWQRYGAMVKDSYQIVQKLAEANKSVLGTETAIKQTIEEETKARDRIASQAERQAENKELLERNYDSFRALYLSGEGNWKTDVPKKYGLPGEAIEQGKTYAEALKIAMEGANKETTEFVEKTSQPAGNLMKDTAEQANNAKEEIKQVVAEVEEVKSQIKVARHDLEDSATMSTPFNESKVVEGLGQVTSTVQNAKGSLQSTSEVTRTLTGEMIGLDDELKQKKHDFNDVANSARNTNKSFSQLMFGAKGLSGGLKKMFPLVNRFMGTVTSRMMRYAIRHMASGFSEGVENLYNYSKLMGTEFAPAMDQAATALQQMKNSIGAAVAPAIQALVPVLQTLVNWFITLVNYANQFFALLSGQNYWTRALPEAAEAFEDSSKKAKKAGKEMKDLLADWDELNIIQSQSGGGSGSSGKHTDEEYKNMFERVEEFNQTVKDLVEGIKDQFGSVWNVVKKIGAALLGWKFSKAFGGLLGILGGILAAGSIMDLVFNVAVMLDNQYVKTGDKGWLIADILTTAIGSYFAGKAISSVLGTGMGLVTAGITFALSAGATFGVASNVKNESEKGMLQLTGAIKLGLADALATAGFIAAGVGTGLSIIGGVVTVGLVAAIGYSMEIAAKKAKEYDKMAEEAFANAGEGGISADEYLAALQTELDKQTEGASLVVKAYMDVPDLQDKLTDVVRQIEAVNGVIFGDQKLTKEDAKAFKENWKTVLETLDSMNKKRYETILAGLNDALLSANKDLKERASELRTTFIQIEKNVSSKTAKMYKEIEDITERITEGKTKKGDLDRYKTLLESIYKMTDTTFDEVERIKKLNGKINFKGDTNSIDKAMSFIGQVQEVVKSHIETEKTALENSRESIEAEKRNIDALVHSGYMDPGVAKEAKENLDKVFKIIEENTNEKIKEMEGYTTNAYNQVLTQALSAAGTDTNAWERIMVPLVGKMKENGFQITEELQNALREGLAGDMETSMNWFYDLSKRGEWKNLDVNGIIGYFIENMDQGFSKHKKNMPSAYIEVADIFKLTGWDLLTDEAYQDMYLSLVEDLGKKKANLVWKGLNLELPKIDTSEAEKKYKEAVENAKKEAKVKEEEEKAKKEAERAKKEAERENEKVRKQQENNEEEFNRQGYNEAVREAQEAMRDKLLTPFEENMLTANLGPEFVEGVKEQLDYVFHDGVPIKLNPYFEKKSAKEQILDGLGLGNINLNNRKVLHNEDGSFSTEYSTTIYDEDKGKHVLIPTIVNGVMVDIEKAIEHYFATGEHLGEFDTPEDAGGYALDLHKRQEWFYGLKDDIEKFMEDGLLDATERISLYKDFGQDKVDAMLEYLKTNSDGSLGNVANPARTRASVQTAVDIGSGSRNTAESPSEPQQVEFNGETMANSVQKGATAANEDVVSQLRTMANYLSQLLSKNWVVNVQPTTAFGRTVTQSQKNYGAVTGDGYTG